MSQKKNVKHYSKPCKPADEVQYKNVKHMPKKSPITNNGK